MAPAARQSLLWSAYRATGYAGARLAAEAALSNAARPGVLEGYGRYLTPTLLALSSAAMLGARLGADTPAGFHLIAPLVGACAP
jgi:hypothetical protein